MSKCSMGHGKITEFGDREFVSDWANDGQGVIFSEEIFTSAQVINMLERIESYRVAISRAEARLLRWQEDCLEFANLWRQFTAYGGVSGWEFHQYLQGKFKARQVRQKRHLRLIASKTKAVWPVTHGNDAA